MADITNITNPQTQDLQISLTDTQKDNTSTTENAPTEIDLNIDLNLEDAPKTEDRLKEEDRKNQEDKIIEDKIIEDKNNTENIPDIKTETIDTLFADVPVDDVPVADVPVADVPVADVTVDDVSADNVPVADVPADNVPVADISVDDVPVADISADDVPVADVPVAEIGENSPSTHIEEITPIQETTIETTPLNNDIHIISELEGNTSAGGLAPEAIITPQTPAVDTPKTFNLDTMFEATINQPQTQTLEADIPITKEIQTTNIPTFTLPIQQETAVQTIIQTTIPEHKKTSGVKTLLFVILFAALGFTTYFIIQTMYPIEMGKIFGGGDTTQMHASETVSGDIIETAGETDNTTEENDTTEIGIENPIDTTGNQENNSFGELNDLETTTNTDTITGDTNLSKLADYVNKGNTLRDQGKTINNTTIIKYGLYISKKATDLLEKIAKGEEISNMDGYFAQFDKYILQLEGLLGTTQNQEISSSEVQAYETTEQNTVPEPTSEPTTNSFTTE